MAEGTIKRLTDKGFGFIDVGRDKDLFFHSSNVVGTNFDDLREGQSVTLMKHKVQKAHVLKTFKLVKLRRLRPKRVAS